MYCGTCDRRIEPAHFIFHADTRLAHCPSCNEPLLPEAFHEGNPVSVAFGLTCLKVVARLLLRAGVLKYLEDKASQSETSLDDFALRVTRSVLEEAAKL